MLPARHVIPTLEPRAVSFAPLHHRLCAYCTFCGGDSTAITQLPFLAIHVHLEPHGD